MYRRHRLTGHYRSKYESLIAFSNVKYYNNELVTYPSASTKDAAVKLKKVDNGIYARGGNKTNAEEAKSVVQEVIRRLADDELSKLSIGIVTFNSQQQKLIEDLLDDERRSNFELEPFFEESRVDKIFVKNLETVQGDQRDVILLSVGYGPSAPGAVNMPMIFGPLNRDGGERRLNVAITRATTEVIIFTSFDSSMIDLTKTQARAVKDLKDYIKYAEIGLSFLGVGNDVGGNDQYDSDFEFEVAHRLRNKGWEVRTQIGVSGYRIDLGIIHPDHPGSFLAGIECDGATYHSSPSARDRDRIRQTHLESSGWRLVRIWSTSYFFDPESTIDEVDRKLNQLLEEDRGEVEILLN